MQVFSPSPPPPPLAMPSAAAAAALSSNDAKFNPTGISWIEAVGDDIRRQRDRPDWTTTRFVAK